MKTVQKRLRDEQVELEKVLAQLEEGSSELDIGVKTAIEMSSQAEEQRTLEPVITFLENSIGNLDRSKNIKDALVVYESCKNLACLGTADVMIKAPKEDLKKALELVERAHKLIPSVADYTGEDKKKYRPYIEEGKWDKSFNRWKTILKSHINGLGYPQKIIDDLAHSNF